MRSISILLLTLSAACRDADVASSAAPDHEALLAEAQRAWDARHDEASAIWVGRRLAYLERYEEAITWYGDRLVDFPDSYRLLRHRGHRWITMRDFASAQADLERAWELARAQPDRVEPDGMPNARGVPTSTDHTNILYHLALAQYLQGEFEEARRSWELCHRAAAAGATGDDMEVAAAYWQHVAGARAGTLDEASDLARTVAPELDIVENHAYHRLCLLLTGRVDAARLATTGEDEMQDASLLYGLARWHAEHGREEEERVMLERIVGEAPPASFAHIAAEADLRRRALDGG